MQRQGLGGLEVRGAARPGARPACCRGSESAERVAAGRLRPSAHPCARRPSGPCPTKGGPCRSWPRLPISSRLQTAARHSRPRGARGWRSLGRLPSAWLFPATVSRAQRVPTRGDAGAPTRGDAGSRWESPEGSGEAEEAALLLPRPRGSGRGSRSLDLRDRIPGERGPTPGVHTRAVRPASRPARAERVRASRPADPVALCRSL